MDVIAKTPEYVAELLLKNRTILIQATIMYMILFNLCYVAANAAASADLKQSLSFLSIECFIEEYMIITEGGINDVRCDEAGKEEYAHRKNN